MRKGEEGERVRGGDNMRAVMGARTARRTVSSTCAEGVWDQQAV